MSRNQLTERASQWIRVCEKARKGGVRAELESQSHVAWLLPSHWSEARVWEDSGETSLIGGFSYGK